MAPELVPLMLRVWQLHPDDREVTEAMEEVIGHIAKSPRSLAPVQQIVMPMLNRIIAHAASFPSGVVEGARGGPSHRLTAAWQSRSA
jgi:hypothetical protein